MFNNFIQTISEDERVGSWQTEREREFRGGETRKSAPIYSLSTSTQYKCEQGIYSEILWFYPLHCSLWLSIIYYYINIDPVESIRLIFEVEELHTFIQHLNCKKPVVVLTFHSLSFFFSIKSAWFSEILEDCWHDSCP